MADRYQDRPFPGDDDHDRGHQGTSKSESDPLAELARLIGQTDPFASIGGRANQPAPPRDTARDRYPEPEPEPALDADDAPAGPPPWMQRAAAQIPARGEDNWQDDDDAPHGLPSDVHPVQRYAASHAAEVPEYHQAPSFALPPDQVQPSAAGDHYDDALYGALPGALAAPPPETHYDEPYSYQDDDYADGADEHGAKPRRGGMIMVAAVLALAVVGTGAAFGYRTYVGAARSGEPPVVKADPGPTKIIPPTQSADASGKLIQDRMAGGAGAGAEKMVSREEQPVDLKDPKGGPRVVFPPLNQNANPPPPSSVAPGTRPATNAGNGTLGDEPRKIHTFAVRGEQADAGPVSPPVAKPSTIVRSTGPAPAARTTTSAPTQAGNAPLSLTPQANAAPPPPADTRRMAANASATPQQIAPQPITPR